MHSLKIHFLPESFLRVRTVDVSPRTVYRVFIHLVSLNQWCKQDQILKTKTKITRPRPRPLLTRSRPECARPRPWPRPQRARPRPIFLVSDRRSQTTSPAWTCRYDVIFARTASSTNVNAVLLQQSTTFDNIGFEHEHSISSVPGFRVVIVTNI